MMDQAIKQDLFDLIRDASRLLSSVRTLRAHNAVPPVYAHCASVLEQELEPLIRLFARHTTVIAHFVQHGAVRVEQRWRRQLSGVLDLLPGYMRWLSQEGDVDLLTTVIMPPETLEAFIRETTREVRVWFAQQCSRLVSRDHPQWIQWLGADTQPDHPASCVDSEEDIRLLFLAYTHMRELHCELNCTPERAAQLLRRVFPTRRWLLSVGAGANDKALSLQVFRAASGGGGEEEIGDGGGDQDVQISIETVRIETSTRLILFFKEIEPEMESGFTRHDAAAAQTPVVVPAVVAAAAAADGRLNEHLVEVNALQWSDSVPTEFAVVYRTHRHPLTYFVMDKRRWTPACHHTFSDPESLYRHNANMKRMRLSSVRDRVYRWWCPRCCRQRRATV